jgi:photosystem II stability/assembly factor-like uncharacterized protein
MIDIVACLGRRAFLSRAAVASVVAANLDCNSAFGGAAYPFDTSAIPVLTPSENFLIAVADTGPRLVAVGVHGLIIFSDDQGQTWHQADVPVNVTLTCVAFSSPRIGWAAGHYGVILKTEDSGATWRHQLNGLQVNQLQLAAAQNPVLATNPAPTAQYAIRRAEAFQNGGPNRPFLSILPISEERVFVFGAYRMTVESFDGGSTWVDRSLDVYDELSHNLYDACLVSNDIYIAAEAGMVFHGTINGSDFQALPSPSLVTLLGVLTPASQILLVFGVAGNCYRSADGGNSWTPIDVGTQVNLTAGRRLVSGAVILASESGGLYESKDSGVTFSAISGLPQMSIFDFLVLPSGDIVFVGAGGVVRVTRSA